MGIFCWQQTKWKQERGSSISYSPRYKTFRPVASQSFTTMKNRMETIGLRESKKRTIVKINWVREREKEDTGSKWMWRAPKMEFLLNFTHYKGAHGHKFPHEKSVMHSLMEKNLKTLYFCYTFCSICNMFCKLSSWAQTLFLRIC